MLFLPFTLDTFPGIAKIQETAHPARAPIEPELWFMRPFIVSAEVEMHRDLKES